MFKNIARTLQNIAVSFARRNISHPELPVPQEEGKQAIRKGKGQLRHTSKRGNAARLKRAATKRNNIRKFN